MWHVPPPTRSLDDVRPTNHSNEPCADPRGRHRRATVAATLLFDAVSREKRQCPREPRGIVEPGKVPGSGLHRQLGMLEETGILGSAAAARRRTHRRATATASKIVLLGVLRRHALGQPVELE